MVASVPELENRTWSSRNRRHSSSAKATVVGVGAAKWVPVAAARSIASTIFGMGVADDVDAEAAVEVDVLVAVDVPHVAALAPLEVDRVRVAGLERRRHPERHRCRPPARTAPSTAPFVRSSQRDRLGVGDLGGARRAELAAGRVAWCRSSELDHHVLELGVVLDRVDRHVLAVAGLLEAAVGHLGDDRDVVVDPDRAELQGRDIRMARPTSRVHTLAARP